LSQGGKTIRREENATLIPKIRCGENSHALFKVVSYSGARGGAVG
jgi:hypothetical protein